MLGLTLPKGFPLSGYCPTLVNWGKKQGAWLPVSEAEADPDNVRVGDLACFWFASKKRIAHIGIVVKVTKSGVWAVEGNTSGGHGVQRDGDGVYRRWRTWDSLGTGGGFIRLPF